MRIDVRKRKVFSEGSGDTKQPIGHVIRFRVVKNKVGTSGGYALIDYFYETGFDKSKALIEAGESAGVINRGGAWYTYEPTHEELPTIKEQGKDAFMDALYEFEDEERDILLNEIKTKIVGGNVIDESEREAVS